jgi:hypothetical protein
MLVEFGVRNLHLSSHGEQLRFAVGGPVVASKNGGRPPGTALATTLDRALLDRKSDGVRSTAVGAAKRKAGAFCRHIECQV